MKIVRSTDPELIATLNREVHELHHMLYPSHFKPFNFEEMKEFYESIIDNPNFYFLVLDNGEEKCGYAWIEIRTYNDTPLTNSYQSIYVHQININSSIRSKGYGTMMMEEIYKIAKNHSIQLIELDYWSTNEKAKQFYKKHGFKHYREFVYKKV